MSDSGEDRICYQPATVSKSDWLQVMQATAEFERLWLGGERPDRQQFVRMYGDLPPGLLDAELAALCSELQAGALGVSACAGDAGIPLISTGRYQRLELLRRGGMGEVYRALDTECGREVAVKKIRADLSGDADVQRRFREEAELTAGLEHPGVIPIYGRGVDESGLSWYVMRLIAGAGAGTLQQSIRRFHADLAGPDRTGSQVKAFSDLVHRVLDVANTMAYAHSRGVVHRDLKPANILIGPYGETLIGDWGLARRCADIPAARAAAEPLPESVSGRNPAMGTAERESAAAGARSSAPFGQAIEDTQRRRPGAAAATCGIGTPGFAAPEQLRGEVWDAVTLRLADVYSLGAILHSLVTGRTPDRDGVWSAAATAGEVQCDPRAVRESAGGKLQLRLLVAICRRAMCAEPAGRYASADEFRDDLERWLGGEPVRAYAEGWSERLQRWPGRHRLATAALVSGLLISVVGGAAFLAVTTRQKNRLAERSIELQQALSRSDGLLRDATEARQLAERERVAGEASRDRAERREAMAFHAISQFYEVFSERADLRSSAELSGVREDVLRRSRRFYERLYQEIEGELIPSDSSAIRLATAALSLASLEHELGHQGEAVQRLEAAVRKLRESQQLAVGGALNVGLSFQLGRLISQQGQLAARYGRFDQAGPQLREALALLEAARGHQGLSAEERVEADRLCVRAVATLALQLGAVGKAAEGIVLAEQVKQSGLSAPAASVEDAMTRIQLHGNLALLLESTGATEESLSELALAEQAADLAEQQMAAAMSAGQRLELLSMRSKAVRSRVRLLQKLNRGAESLAVLQQQLAADEAGVKAFTASHELRNAYGSTSMQLQKQLMQLSRQTEAFDVSQRWIDLAERLLREGTETERDLVFLLGARHTAGHTFDMGGDREKAFEHYSAAVAVCERTSELGFRAPSLVYQVLELHCHLASVQVQISGWSAAVDGFLATAQQAAEELQGWGVQTEVKPESIPRQLQSTVDFFERTGFAAEAGKWKASLRERKLIR
ncbi:MAG: protein kinase domain-containing protein [Planctomyces sp.]